MKNKKTNWDEIKDSLMWLLLVIVLVPFYPALTVENGGIELPENLILGLGIALVAFFLFWKFRDIFKIGYTLYFLWLYALKGDLGSFRVIPDIFNMYNLIFWIALALLILIWEKDLRNIIGGKKKK